MELNKVTVTGADDSIQPEDLQKLIADYPFVEFGILLSATTPKPRFPSREWLTKLEKTIKKRLHLKSHLSGHFCGRLMRDVCEAGIEMTLRPYANLFSRFQFNVMSSKSLNRASIIKIMRRYYQIEFIFQVTEQSEPIIRDAQGEYIDAYPLFDSSGGRGELPKQWPLAKGKSGYAGGLDIKNIVAQIKLISEAANGHEIWIDAESCFRTNERFDLDKVGKFLKKVEKWVK